MAEAVVRVEGRECVWGMKRAHKRGAAPSFLSLKQPRYA